MARMATHDDHAASWNRRTTHNVEDDLTSPNDTARRTTSCPDDAAGRTEKLPFVPPVIATVPSHASPVGGAAATEVQPADNEPSETCTGTDGPDKSLRSRRDVLRHGGKLAFAAPIISTFYASQAYAANYSCYAEGHSCQGAEPCCADLSCNGGECSPFCVTAGDQCFTDSDCCSAVVHKCAPAWLTD